MRKFSILLFLLQALNIKALTTQTYNMLNLNLTAISITMFAVLVQSQVDFNRNIWLYDAMSVTSRGYQLSVPVNNTHPVYIISNDDQAETSMQFCYDMFTMASLHGLRSSCEFLSVCRQGPKFESKILLLESDFDQLSLHKDQDLYKQEDHRECIIYEAQVLTRKSFHKEDIRTVANFYLSTYQEGGNFASWSSINYPYDTVNPEDVCSKTCSDINVSDKFKACLAFNYNLATEKNSKHLCYLLISESLDKSMKSFSEFNLLVRGKLNVVYSNLKNSSSAQGDLYMSYITDPVHTDYIEISQEDLKKYDLKLASIHEEDIFMCGHNCNEFEHCDFIVTWMHPTYRISRCSRVSLTVAKNKESIEKLDSILSSLDQSQYRILAKKKIVKGSNWN